MRKLCPSMESKRAFTHVNVEREREQKKQESERSKDHAKRTHSHVHKKTCADLNCQHITHILIHIYIYTHRDLGSSIPVRIGVDCGDLPYVSLGWSVGSNNHLPFIPKSWQT